MEPEVINYIQEARKHGLADLEIKQNLLNSGWDAAKVEENFAHAKAEEHRIIQNADEDLHNRFSHPDTLLTHAETPLQFNKLPSGEQHNSQPLKNPNPNESLTEQSIKTKKTRKVAIILALVFFCLALVSGSAFAYYTYVYNSPEKIWNAYREASPPTIYKNSLNFSYEDSVDKSSQIAEKLGMDNLHLRVEGQFYVNNSDSKNPQSSSDMQYTAGSGNTDVSTGFKYRLINKIFYLNVGENPFLDGLIAGMNNGKKLEWVKIDINELEQKMKETNASSSEVSSFEKIINQQIQSDISQLWEDSSLVNVNSTIGRETVNGVKTYHYSNSFDKEAFKNFLTAALEKIINSAKENGEKIEPEDKQFAKNLIPLLIDKIQISKFETWVGIEDKVLHKVVLESNAPSIISAIGQGMEKTADLSRDVKRVSDIRQAASALELYYNDFGGYPDSKDGKPQDIEPMYIANFPAAPTPADGGCTDYFNTYWYEPAGEKTLKDGKNLYSSYELTFCLGKNTGGHSAGIAKLTPAGIVTNIPCPSTPENCGFAGIIEDTALSTTDEDRQQAVDFINKWGFSANIKIEAEYSEFEKKETLDIPEEAFDLLDLINSKQVLGAFTTVDGMLE